VLHQHFVHGGGRDVRVERLPAECKEGVESGLELLVGLVSLGNLLDQPLGQLRLSRLELVDRLLEAFDLRLGVGVELIEERGQLLLGSVRSRR
jgi:hypothetical protein